MWWWASQRAESEEEEEEEEEEEAAAELGIGYAKRAYMRCSSLMSSSRAGFTLLYIMYIFLTLPWQI